MGTGRLEAFSDGVIAILLTIMVLELKAPEGGGWAALRPVVPGLSTYALSFIYLGIYWNNHHHLFHAVDRVNGRILWANLHLLFWLSLVPVVTQWVGNNPRASTPAAVYGIVFLCAGLAYQVLVAEMIREQGADSRIARAIGIDIKGKVSLGLYAAAIPLAFLHAWIADAMFVMVALIWFVPDRRMERTA